MPAMLDDPTAPVIYRASGDYGPLSPTIVPRQVTLRDRSTIATLVPFSASAEVPKSLVAYLCALLNREIEKGDTYPMINPLSEDSFGPYWFANFGAIMLLGELTGVDDVWAMEREMDVRGEWDWSKRCLGSFYIKPNYPGRSSHVCNGGFLVTDAARNRGVGRLMGEGYLEWAPKLGYTYSVFNLVYETNIASVRIWDALGFKRIGRVPGCGNLKSHPDTLIDAIIFGRDLNGEAEDYLSEERFDKIRYYLKTGMYPNGSDRAEKSRLRSAGAHYRLVAHPESGEEKLMLKDKEVISDPQKQYEIAHKTHSIAHAGINKTTASIADKYHWIRIKETVSQAIRNCGECRESNKPGGQAKQPKITASSPTDCQPSPRARAPQSSSSSSIPATTASEKPQSHLTPSPAQLSSPQPDHHNTSLNPHIHHHNHNHAMPALTDMTSYDDYDAMPVDPQIMDYQAHHGFGVDQPHPAATTNNASAAAVANQQHQNHHHHHHDPHAFTHGLDDGHQSFFTTHDENQATTNTTSADGSGADGSNNSSNAVGSVSDVLDNDDDGDEQHHQVQQQLSTEMDVQQ